MPGLSAAPAGVAGGGDGGRYTSEGESSDEENDLRFRGVTATEVCRSSDLLAGQPERPAMPTKSRPREVYNIVWAPARRTSAWAIMDRNPSSITDTNTHVFQPV